MIQRTLQSFEHGVDRYIISNISASTDPSRATFVIFNQFYIAWNVNDIRTNVCDAITSNADIMDVSKVQNDPLALSHFSVQILEHLLKTYQ